MEPRPAAESTPHVTLVLGAGGPVARAFHAGVLRALAEVCGWDARAAALVVGTSAGAQTGALLRGGRGAHELFAGVTESHPLVRGGERARWPGSPLYLRKVLRRPWRARLGPLIAAVLPEGAHGNEPLGEALSRLHPARWPLRPLWITAVHLDSGARVVFGRAGAPAADVGTAVRCSSAVPGLERPVRVGPGGERYVDGGIRSATHVDLVAASGSRAARRLALVLSPLSRFAPLRLGLRAELRALGRGIELALFEPDAEVMTAMGWNPLDPRVVPRVAESAYRTTVRRLHRRDAAPLRAIVETATGAPIN